MLYNQLEWIIQPFFLSRWWSSLAQLDNIQSYINLAIQDVYNENNWTFKIINEAITTYVDENWKRRFESTENIDMFIEAKDQYWNDIFPTVNMIYNKTDWYKKMFNFSWKNIYFLDDTDVTEIYVTYTKSYVWYNRVVDWWKEIPLPDKFIPAVIKSIYDYSAPINLFEWEETQADFFWHYTNRINKLKDIDSVSEITFIQPYNHYYN